MLLVFIVILGQLCAQAVNELSFPLPQFMNPIYDGFTRNYGSATAAGRGYTGISKLGGVDQILHNPASYLPDEASMYVNLSLKPPITEIDTENSARYSSPIPFGMVALGKSWNQRISAAAVYSVPKSIVYDEFSMVLGQGASLLQRYPTYYLHQLTGSLSYHNGPWHAGINLHNQIHYFDDIIFYRTFDRVRKSSYILRPEIGFLYQGELFGLGLTAMPQQEITIDTPYIEYEANLPTKLGAGISLTMDNRSLSLEAEYEQTSSLSDAYSDRLCLRTGYEYRKGKMTYRLGLMSNPGIYEGRYLHPVNNTASQDTTFIWNDMPTGGNLDNQDQFLFSMGFTFHHKDGTVNLALIQDVLGKFPATQVNLSLGLYLSSFKRREISN